MYLFDKRKNAADIYDEGETYFRNGDYINAVQCYYKAAKNYADAVIFNYIFAEQQPY